LSRISGQNLGGDLPPGEPLQLQSLPAGPGRAGFPGIPGQPGPAKPDFPGFPASRAWPSRIVSAAEPDFPGFPASPGFPKPGPAGIPASAGIPDIFLALDLPEQGGASPNSEQLGAGGSIS